MSDLIKATDERSLYASLRDLKIKSYSPGNLNQYLDYLDESGFGLADGLLPYIDALRSDGWTDRNGKKHTYKAAAIQTKIAAAKRLGDYVIDQHPEMFTPTVQLAWEKAKKAAKGPKSEKGVNEDKCLEWKEVQLLLAQTKNEKVRLVILVLAQTAARINEALNMRIDDMVKNGTHYKIRIDGKGDKERYVKVRIPHIETIISTFGSKTWLFEHDGQQYNNNSMTSRIATEGQRVLGKRVSAHMMRHAWATQQVKLGRPLAAISRYLGHASTSVTNDNYIHVRLSDDEAMLPVTADPDTEWTKVDLEDDPEDEAAVLSKLERI
jgi:integrase